MASFGGVVGRVGRVGQVGRVRPVQLAGVVVVAVTMIALTAAPVLANGGTVQLSNVRAGPYLVSVFTNPNPIRVGSVDVSVLVQQPGIPDVVEDAFVMVKVDPVDHAGMGETFEA